MSGAYPDKIVNCSSGGDVIFTIGAYPGTEVLRMRVVGGQGILLVPPGGSSPLVSFALATTAADGTTSTFAFADKIGTLVMAFIGGIPQLPADVSVDADGNLVFAANVTPPEVPVTALFVRAS
jgi:hypothetical protein